MVIAVVRLFSLPFIKTGDNNQTSDLHLVGFRNPSVRPAFSVDCVRRRGKEYVEHRARKNGLIGAWKLKTAKNPGSPPGIGTRLKRFTGTHWCVVQPDPASGKIVFQHGGHYSFDGSVLSETIDFAGDLTSSLIGRTFKHKLKIANASLEQIDPEGVFNETWERGKAPQSK